MATPFDHMKEFQGLDPDTKDQIMQKFQTLPPEDQQKAMAKANTPMQNRGLEPGLENLSMTPLTRPDMDKSAVTVSQALAPTFGPTMSTIVGAAFESIPPAIDTAITVGGAASLAKSGIQAAPAVAERLAPILKAFTPGAKAAAGEAIKTAETMAGVKQIAPTVSNTAKSLNLPPRERQFADIVNKVKGQLDNGEEITAQNLKDFRDLVRQHYGEGKIIKGTTLDALATQSNKKAGVKLNELVPGRAQPSADFATISKIQNGLKVLGKSAGYAGAGAAGLGLAKIILKKLAGY